MSVPPPGPLAYEGQVVVPFIVRDFPPTTAFNQFSVPTIWIQPSTEDAYILTGKPHGVANWLLFVNGGGNVGTLKGNTGAAVGPTVGGLINVVGDGTTITIAGNPGTNTLTASLVGGGTAIDSITVDAATAPGTNPVVSNGAGLIAITGAQVATGTVGANVIRTDSLAANTLTVEVQRSTAVAATDSTKNGVSHFDSSMFSVDGSGFVSLSGGGQAIDSFIPDSGTSPVVPAANGSVTMSGSGSITTVGGLNSLTTELTGLTNHAVLVGAGTATITKVGPSATTGAPLISAGAAADPAFSTTFRVLDSTPQAIISTSTVGGDVQLSVQNTDNTNASSAARLTITAGGNSAGDAYALFDANQSGKNFEIGCQQSSSSFLINWAANTAISNINGTNVFKISSTGAATFNSAFTFPTADGTTGQVLTTNGAGVVSWSNSGVGTWTDNSGTFTASRNSAYFLTAASTVTLPASPAQGDTVDFVCDTTGSCVITGNTGQSIRIANQLSSVAGTATNSARGDSLTLVYRSTGTTWFADVAPNGGWTTA